MSDENKEILAAEEQDVDTSVDSETNDTLNEEEEVSTAAYDNQKRRAEKAEAKLKELKDTMGEKTEEKTEEKEQTGLTREEAILFAQGLSEEEINHASKIAKVDGTSLTEAVGGDFFKTWKKSNEDKVRSEKAQLGTSKGSPKVEGKKDFNTPNLSKDEHKELFMKSQGR